MNALVLYSPPALAPELREQVELITGPALWHGNGDDDPGFRVAPRPATYHPDAQREADTRRATLAQPADPQVIRLWVQTLAAGNGNAPRSEADLAMWLSALVFTCGDDLPGAVWGAVSLRQAMRTFKKFWPNVGEVFEFLEAHAIGLRAEISALERIAKGERPSYWQASTAYLDAILASGSAAVPPENPAHPSSPRPGIADDSDDIGGRHSRPIFPYAAPLRTVEQQLAALGMGAPVLKKEGTGG